MQEKPPEKPPVTLPAVKAVRPTNRQMCALCDKQIPAGHARTFSTLNYMYWFHQDCYYEAYDELGPFGGTIKRGTTQMSNSIAPKPTLVVPTKRITDSVPAPKLPVPSPEVAIQMQKLLDTLAELGDHTEVLRLYNNLGARNGK